MKLSEVNTQELDNDLIKKIFFGAPKEHYDYADYVVIYGCHIKDLLDERLNTTLEVLRNHAFGKVVLSGGVGVCGDFNESEYMKQYFLDHGIEESKIIVENQSRTTEENNLNVMDLLQLKSIDRPTNIVLVTQAFHLFRIIIHWAKILENKNIHFYYAPVEGGILSYEKVINDPGLIDMLRGQLGMAKEFIAEGKSTDPEIDAIYREPK